MYDKVKRMTSNKENEGFGNKFQELVQVFQRELKKTTQIGMKMISASQSNSELKDTYERLGILTAKALANSELTWNNEKIVEILSKIESLKVELSSLEDAVQTIKKDD
jgi:site-specific DNA-adenine methylase